jgi:hypothetical protein
MVEHKLELYTNLLLNLIGRLGTDIILLQTDYNLRYSEIESEKNFWIAITAWFLGFVGLIISIVGLILSIDSIRNK